MAQKQVLLGKNSHVADSRDLMLSNYIRIPVLLQSDQAPADPDWQSMPTPDGSLPVHDNDALGNDVAGNCVLAGPGHMVNMIGKQVGNPSLNVTAPMALAAYSKYTGYTPGNKSTDNGWMIRDMLKAWKTDGLYGTKILAYAAVNWKDELEVALATWISGGLIGGYTLTSEVWDQVDSKGRPQWFVPKSGFGKGIGGHCIYTHGVRNGNTWGESVVWTQDWATARCDELWMPIVDGWQLASGLSPNGFAFQQLLSDAVARS